MLQQPLLDKLSQLRLNAFRIALEEQWLTPHYADLAFEERLGLLLDIEVTQRTHNRLQRRIRAAKFSLPATLQDFKLEVIVDKDHRLIHGSKSAIAIRTD